MRRDMLKRLMVLGLVIVFAFAFTACEKKTLKNATTEEASDAEEDGEDTEEDTEEEIVEGEYRQVTLPDGTEIELADNEAYLDGLIYQVDKDASNAVVAYPVDYEIKEVNVPENIEFNHGSYPVVGIAEGALSGLDNLENVKLGDNVEFLETDSVYGNPALKTFTAGSGLTTIEDNALAGCDELTTVTLNEGLESIGTDAFSSNPKLKEISIPSTVTSFGETVFIDCENLTKVVMPEGVSGLGIGMFTNCYALKEVKLPSTVKEIPNELFYCCESLSGRFDIPDSVKAVGIDAFYNTSFTELRVPSGLRDVEESTFDGIDTLKTLYVSSSEVRKYKKLYEDYDFKVAAY